eukprot:CAMPEP_0115709570 /NCGR_PEP_ID=MMETSP0272-20121206/72541_1 /TAXON_ID=71861 /ORGANISM="Scrippsiella trochoidea, Strain CCMP3099" /LENGTH=150 /DNA_ID=CAMNT_0003151187 /DNA_START=104 /DNA_END=553 /DNA_ORIENTATION=+
MGIAMIRNPISWLHSMHHIAYDINPCVHGTNWLTKTCKYPSHVDGGNLLAGLEFPNLEAIWTNWTLDYESLTSFGFKRGLLVRYEDLVLDTDRIDSFTNLTRSAETRLVERGVNPGKKKNLDSRAHAIVQIQKKSYLKDGQLSQEWLEQA